MKYYIEAYDIAGRQIRGNLDGQAALGEPRAPQRTKAWRLLNEVKHSAAVAFWYLVDAEGRIIARKRRMK